jgi:hypothetical protein
MNATHEKLIRQWADDSVDLHSLFQTVLQWLIDQTESSGGIAWEFAGSNRTAIAQLQATDSPSVVIKFSPEYHQQIQRKAIEAGRSIIVRPEENSDARDQPVILMSPLTASTSSNSTKSQFLLELFLPNDLAEDRYRFASQSLDSVSTQLSDLKLPSPTTEPSKPSTKTISLSELDQFIHEIHRSIDLKETCVRIANETRKLLDCDRVCVVRAKARPEIVAISGQASVNRRSNVVQSMQRLLRRVLPTKQAMWYPSEKSLPPQIEKPLADFLENSGTRSMQIAPLFDRAKDENLPPDQKPIPRRVIGAIVLENHRERWQNELVEPSFQLAVQHAENAYRNAYQHRQLLLYPVWNWLGKTKTALFVRNLSKTVAATIAVVIAALVFSMVQVDFTIPADGILIPQHRSNVFAPVDGTVTKMAVQHGTPVDEGQVLLTLQNIDLESQAAELEGKINQLTETIRSTETLLLAGDKDVDQPLSESTLNSQQAELKSYLTQRKLIESKIDKLSVTAPRKGTVVTWNLESRFQQRPINQGELLMEVVDVEGTWQVELQVVDRHAGHLMEAAKKTDGPLGVEFILAADTSKTHHGTIVEIGQTTILDPELGACVKVLVATDSEIGDIQQIRSGVNAKIVCGKSSLGYSWFHGVGEFLQKHWFQLF